jgi:hypothetical protein
MNGKEWSMTEQSVIGVYSSMADAEDAVRALDRDGYPISQVSIVARDLQSEQEVHGFVTTGDASATGAVTGAWVGGLFGLLLGAAFLWIPVIGPVFVAGPLAASLLGMMEGGLLGAAGGGLLGAAIGWGVAEDDVAAYEKYLRGGKYLVIAHGIADEVAWAYDVLQRQGETTELSLHGAVASAA